MLSAFLTQHVGVNWKTTIAGVMAIVTVAGKLLLAYRTKDIAAILSNGQELMEDIGLVLIGIGLIKAKDSNTVGAGVSAAKIHDN